jgi:AcrR family transcriptional regulator
MPADTPRPSLTRDRIVAAAIRRADRKGMERLSMRALAGDLGVEAMRSTTMSATRKT